MSEPNQKEKDFIRECSKVTLEELTGNQLQGFSCQSTKKQDEHLENNYETEGKPECAEITPEHIFALAKKLFKTPIANPKTFEIIDELQRTILTFKDSHEMSPNDDAFFIQALLFITNVKNGSYILNNNREYRDILARMECIITGNEVSTIKTRYQYFDCGNSYIPYFNYRIKN